MSCPCRAPGRHLSLSALNVLRDRARLRFAARVHCEPAQHPCCSRAETTNDCERPCHTAASATSASARPHVAPRSTHHSSIVDVRQWSSAPGNACNAGDAERQLRAAAACRLCTHAGTCSHAPTQLLLARIWCGAPARCPFAARRSQLHAWVCRQRSWAGAPDSDHLIGAGAETGTAARPGKRQRATSAASSSRQSQRAAGHSLGV